MTWLGLCSLALFIFAFFLLHPLGTLILSIAFYFDQKRLFLRKEYLEKYPPKKSRFKFINWWRNR